MNVGEVLKSIVGYDEHIGGLSDALKTLDPSIASAPATFVTHDHRRVSDGAIFVAFSGTAIDSHQYISEARSAGASCIVGATSSTENLDIAVTNPRALLGPISSVLNNNPSAKMKLVGITGTNGKTTTSYLYSSIIQAHNRDCFTMGTTGILVNSEKEFDSQTTPDPLIVQSTFSDFLDRNVLDGVLEVSSHALNQYRVLGTHFSAVGFTNFSQDHLDYHESMESYFEAKELLFSNTYAPKAVINIDDSRGEEIVAHAQKNGVTAMTVSCKDTSADLFVECTSMDLEGSTLNIKHDGRSQELRTTLIGEFNHENIAVALGLAMSVGCVFEISCEALSSPHIVPGRLQRPEVSTVFSIFIDYAHTPDALERVLKMVKPLAKKTIVVFGCGESAITPSDR